MIEQTTEFSTEQSDTSGAYAIIMQFWSADPGCRGAAEGYIVLIAPAHLPVDSAESLRPMRADSEVQVAEHRTTDSSSTPAPRGGAIAHEPQCALVFSCGSKVAADDLSQCNRLCA